MGWRGPGFSAVPRLLFMDGDLLTGFEPSFPQAPTVTLLPWCPLWHGLRSFLGWEPSRSFDVLSLWCYGHIDGSGFFPASGG